MEKQIYQIFKFYTFVKLLFITYLISQLSCTKDSGNNAPSEETIMRGSVAGRILTTKNLPIQNATVSLLNDTAVAGGYTTVSDSAGFFRIPDVLNGTYTLSISAAGFICKMQVIKIAIDQDLYFTDPFHLISESGFFKGVIYKENNQPLTGVSLSFRQSKSIQTLNNGTFGTSLKADTYQVELLKPGYLDTTISNIIIIPEETTSVTIRMTNANGIINGTVLTADSKPLAGAQISVPQTGENTTSSSDGTFSLTLKHGVYSVEVSLQGYLHFKTDSVIVNPEGEIILPVKMINEKGALKGFVTGDNNVPLSGVLISVANTTTTASSGNDGSFAIQLKAGTYTLYFSKASYRDTSIKNIHIDYDKTDSIRLTMKSIAYTVSGVVTDLNSAPVSGASITLTHGQKIYSEMTNNNGMYQIKSVSPDSYSLSIVHPNYETVTIKNVVITADTLLDTVRSSLTMNVRSFSGSFIANGKMVDSVIAVVIGDGFTSPLYIPCDYAPQSGDYSFSGIFKTPSTGKQWTIQVLAYDSSDRRCGQSMNIKITSTDGDITVPAFNATNAVPVISKLGLPDTVNINNIFTPAPIVIDSFGGSIVSWEWKADTSSYKARNASMSIRKAGNFMVKLTVKDDQGNICIDSSKVTVVNTIPVVSEISLFFNDSILAPKAGFKINASESYGGRIKLVRFDFDNNGQWDDSLHFDTINASISYIKNFGTTYGKSTTVTVQIQDDDNNKVQKKLDIFQRLYVNIASKATVQNGLSWMTAFSSFLTASTTAKQYKFKNIWVAKGTYSSIEVTDSMNVIGGFNGDETLLSQRKGKDLDGNGITSSWELMYATEITNGNQARNVYLSKGAILNGVTIRDANIDEHFQSLPEPSIGAGILIETGGTLINSVVKNNKTWYNGGGIYCQNGTIKHCLLTGNSAGYYGGGIYIVDGSISDCIVRNSKAGKNGGGIFVCGTASPIVFSSLFDHDTATGKGGAVYVDSQAVNAHLTNLTVAYSHAETTGGIHIVSKPTSGTILCNSAIAGNSDQLNTTANFNFEITDSPGDNAVRVYSCAVEKYSSFSRYFSSTEQIIPGTALSTVTISNFFQNPSNGDFHPKQSDPYMTLIDKGDNTYVPSWADFDLDGNARKNSYIDLGAYEK
jgi:hypothetical protein